MYHNNYSGERKGNISTATPFQVPVEDHENRFFYNQKHVNSVSHIVASNCMNLISNKLYFVVASIDPLIK